MTESGIELLSHMINPETAGVVWLTDELLDYNSPGAYEMNYLLDGVFAQTLAQTKEEDKKPVNFFLGENFGKPFFVAHTAVGDKSGFKKVYQTLETARPFIREGVQVYILNRSKNTANINVLKELKSKYPDVEFEHLNI